MGNATTAAKNLELVNGPLQAEYRNRVETALSELRARGVTIALYGKLIAEVSSLTRIHRTSLKRNSLYNTMILVHFLRQKGGIGALDEEGAPPEVLLAKLRQVKTELLAAKREIRELRSEFAKQILSVSDQASPNTTASSDSSLSHVDFTNLGKLILELVDRSDGTFEIDFQGGTFLDLAAAPGRQKFGGPPQSTQFMKWARGHRAYLETVQQLTKLAGRKRRPD
ncbi:hypothetical protein V4C53_10535 [Paraburkholderia azotifigens]|uniref:hypothetical protein n=1 Tax=Paraburkholderia azotifigens TaxID=2057004 RepID=UPI0031810C0E